jgi:hypothetical protein
LWSWRREGERCKCNRLAGWRRVIYFNSRRVMKGYGGYTQWERIEDPIMHGQDKTPYS